MFCLQCFLIWWEPFFVNHNFRCLFVFQHGKGPILLTMNCGVYVFELGRAKFCQPRFLVTMFLNWKGPHFFDHFFCKQRGYHFVNHDLCCLCFWTKGPILLPMCVLFQVIFGHEKVTILLTRIVGVYFLIWDGPHFVNHDFWIRGGPHFVNNNFWCLCLFDVGRAPFC